MIKTKEFLKLTSYYIFLGILAYIPLHIFLSTWFGSSFNLLEPARILKDIVMLLGFILALILSVRQKWFSSLIKNRLIWLIAAYGIYALILALVKSTDQDAEILGLVYNTRFLIFFIYAILVYNLISKERNVRKEALMAVMGSAFIVLLFGLIQYTVMPSAFLEKFGYIRSNGVLPAFFIDDKPDLERIMSTLRDPNSYGSYLIIIGSIAAAALAKNKRLKNIALGFLGLTSLNLIFTFSRSAWIGFIVALFVILAFSVRGLLNKKQIKYLSLGVISAGLIFTVALVSQWNSYFVQNVIFHADQSTTLEDPNELRIRFWKESLQGVANDPVGSGPGTAGLASIRNNVQGTELNENYYLQIASEVGILGFILFMAILVTIALKLYPSCQKDWLALALLASFAGLAITNFLVHIWSNEAVAYTWWGLAGIILAKSLTLRNKKSS